MFSKLDPAGGMVSISNLIVIFCSFRPRNFEHRFHVEREKNGHLKNLPAEWENKINNSVS